MKNKSTCVHCGTSVDTFLQSGLLGCSNCYTAFLTKREIDLFSRASLECLSNPIPKIYSFKESIEICQKHKLSIRFRLARNFRNQFYSPDKNSLTYRKIDEFLALPAIQKFNQYGNLHFFDEDHIRAEFYLQSLDCYKNKFPEIFYDTSIFDFHSVYGFLTACPTNSGMGNKISIEIDHSKISSKSLTKINSNFEKNIISNSKNNFCIFIKNYKKRDLLFFLNLFLKIFSET
jgi:hypothetical protein